MGQRGASQSIAAILQAFLRSRTWTQAALARELQIGVPALKKHLKALEDAGLPLERQDDHPHVYWSVPQSWFPGGVVYRGPDVEVLLRQLSRLPRSKDRERLIEIALDCLTGDRQTRASGLPRVVMVRETSEPEAEHLSVIEDSATQQRTLHCRYFSTRGSESWRNLSVQRIVSGSPVRFAAICHRDGNLKWFRVDNVLDARLDEGDPYRTVDGSALSAFLASSLDGFYEEGEPETHVFSVRHPEARWVAKNLLEGMQHTESPEGIRITVRTTGLQRLASYVVGLGAAAQIETPSLARAVAALARGALSALDRQTTA